MRRSPKRSRSALGWLVLACLAGCGTSVGPGGGTDGGIDAGNGALDAGDGGADAGDDGMDAGGVVDAGSRVDAGNSVDAGGGIDAGDTGPDAGDAGSPDAGEANLCQSIPVGAVSLPADDAQHNAEIEWWYWSGHLQAPDGGAYGFEEVFFRTSALGVVSQSVNVALTDIVGQRFLYSSGAGLGAPAMVTNGFELSVGGQSADGGGGQDWLHGEPESATYDLELQSVKAPVLQGGTGYITYPNGDWTYYYSRELLNVTGSLSVDGELLPVTGEAWFDHQWGQLQSEVLAGWEWFSIQLDDGRTLMLNWPLVNGAPGPASGSLSDADCNVTQIGSSDLALSTLGSWTSPHTGCSYPSGWQISVLGLSLTITPDLQDQELAATGGPVYWEGSSTVSGGASGKAYVELNGFCP